LGKFDVLAEESDVILGEMLVLIVILLLDKNLLQFTCPNPREKLDFESTALVDVILESQFHLLYLALRVSFAVP
jgi:hypothetical protein